MAETRAQLNRRIRQEALREQLSKQKHIEQVIENIKEIEKPDVDKDRVIALEKANNARMKLVNKYLPDLKLVDAEVTGEGGGPIEGKFTVEFESLDLSFTSFIHKDYNINNLIYLPNRKEHYKCGIIDFQNSFWG